MIELIIKIKIIGIIIIKIMIEIKALRTMIEIIEMDKMEIILETIIKMEMVDLIIEDHQMKKEQIKTLKT